MNKKGPALAQPTVSDLQTAPKRAKIVRPASSTKVEKTEDDDDEPYVEDLVSAPVEEETEAVEVELTGEALE